MLADFMTIKEKFGHLKGITLTYVGDGRDNVADSLSIAGSMLGVNINIVTPKPLFTHPDVQVIAEKFAKDSGSQNMITDDIAKGVKGANVIYTDVWVSMGENDWSERIKLLKPYTVNMKVMKTTATPNEKDSCCFRR